MGRHMVWPHRLSVRPLGFHPGKEGSTPSGVTTANQVVKTVKRIQVFYKGFIIFFNNVQDVILSIDQQNNILKKQQAIRNPNEAVIVRTYEYLQRLVDVHSRIFPSGVSLILSLVALIISVLALVISVIK